MVSEPVYNIEKQKVSDIELNDMVFNSEINPYVLYEVVRKNLASKRKGTASTKNKAIVRGGGKKPYRQKGTGRARAGSIRSPLWRGGGTIFGPMPRDYNFPLPKKVRRLALRGALSLKRQEGKLILLDKFPLENYKTRDFSEILKRFQVKDALIVIDEKNSLLERSARNIPDIEVTHYDGLNVYDILNHDHLIMLSSVAEKIQGVLTS